MAWSLIVSPVGRRFVLCQVSLLNGPYPGGGVDFIVTRSKMLSCPLVAPTSEEYVPISWHPVSATPRTRYMVLAVVVPQSMTSFD